MSSGGVDVAAIQTKSTRSLNVVVEPGRIVGLVGSAGTGLTRWGLSLLVEPSLTAPVVVVDSRGWLCPVAAWEVGIPPERLYVVRCPDRTVWPQVIATLAAGVRALYAEVPEGTSYEVLRRIAAVTRKERTGLILRSLHGELPAGISYLRIAADQVRWEGPEHGHGQLLSRRITAQASGKGAAGIERQIEVEDDGKNSVYLVGGLAASPTGRAIG